MKNIKLWALTIALLIISLCVITAKAQSFNFSAVSSEEKAEVLKMQHNVIKELLMQAGYSDEFIDAIQRPVILTQESFDMQKDIIAHLIADLDATDKDVQAEYSDDFEELCIMGISYDVVTHESTLVLIKKYHNEIW